MVQISTPGVTPNRGMAPREALFVKLLWPLVCMARDISATVRPIGMKGYILDENTVFENVYFRPRLHDGRAVSQNELVPVWWQYL